MDQRLIESVVGQKTLTTHSERISLENFLLDCSSRVRRIIEKSLNNNNDSHYPTFGRSKIFWSKLLGHNVDVDPFSFTVTT